MVFIVCAHTTPLPLILISNIMKEPRRSSSRKMNRTIALPRSLALSLLLDFELKKDPLVSLDRGEEREIKREIKRERERSIGSFNVH